MQRMETDYKAFSVWWFRLLVPDSATALSAPGLGTLAWAYYLVLLLLHFCSIRKFSVRIATPIWYFLLSYSFSGKCTLFFHFHASWLLQDGPQETVWSHALMNDDALICYIMNTLVCTLAYAVQRLGCREAQHQKSPHSQILQVLEDNEQSRLAYRSPHVWYWTSRQTIHSGSNSIFSYLSNVLQLIYTL